MADTKTEKLAESIDKIIEYWDFSPAQDEDSRIERVRNEINSLIAKARTELLDELEVILQPTMKSNSDNEYMRIGHNAAMKNTLAVIEAARKRIGEEKR